MKTKRYRCGGYRCGGYASYSGHCGALDCETCHPGGAAAMRLEDATSELNDKLRLVLDELATFSSKVAESKDEAAEIAARIEDLEIEADRLEGEIDLAERNLNQEDDDDFEPPDYDDPRIGEGEVDWEGPY